MKSWRRGIGILVVLLVLALASFNAYGQGCGSQHLTAEWVQAGAEVGLPIPGLIAKIIKAGMGVMGELLLPEVKITVEFRDTLKVTHDCLCKPPCRGPGTFLASLTVYSIVKPPGYYGFEPVEGEKVIVVGASDFRSRELKEGEQITSLVGANQVVVDALEGSVRITAGLSWLLELTSTRATVDASGVCQCSSRDRCLDPRTNHPPVLRAPAQVPLPSGERTSFPVSVRDEDNDVIEINTSEEGEVAYVSTTRGSITYAEIMVASPGEVRILVGDQCGNTAAVDVRVVEVHRPKIVVEEIEREDTFFIVKGSVIDEDLNTRGTAHYIPDCLTFFLFGVNGEAYRPHGVTVWGDCICVSPCPWGFIFKPDREKIARVGWGGALLKVRDAWGLEDGAWVIFRYEEINQLPEVQVIPGGSG